MQPTTQPPARFRLVILDFDGTLADSWPWLVGALGDTARHFGLPPVTPALAETLRGQDSRAALSTLGVPTWQVPRLAAHLRRLAAEAPAPPLFPGIPALLRRLSGAGLALAIASSNTEAQIRRALGGELAGLVGHIAAGASVFGKAARFRRLLRATGIPAAAAIAIGDETRDIEAARAAGIAAGAVAWGYAAAPLLAAHRPDMLFTSPEDIARSCGA
jgi:phosphoglycolate phosphatase